MKRTCLLLLFILAADHNYMVPAVVAEDWVQFQFDARHSGNAANRKVALNDLGLQGAVALSDGIYTAPVVADGKVYSVDGAGVAYCLDVASLQVLWKFAGKGGPQNCNNVSSPAIAGGYLHFGTTAGFYYVLDRATGAVVAEIDCHEPVFSTPVVGANRVYFATLGSRVYALKPDGGVVWQWDFVKEVIGLQGNRWSGEDWLAFHGARVTWRDHFVCSRDICLIDRTLILPVGGRTLFLEDAGDAARLRGTGKIPNLDGDEFPATFGQSADEAGRVYVQWHRRDNVGRVDILRLEGDAVKTGAFVPGTETSIRQESLLSFAPVSIRGNEVFRVRPENGAGLCRHRSGEKRPQVLCGKPAISPPVLTQNHALYGGLDGALHVVPLDGGRAAAFPTALGAPITLRWRSRMAGSSFRARTAVSTSSAPAAMPARRTPLPRLGRSAVR